MGLIDANKIPYLHLDLENKVRFDDVNIAFKDDIDNMLIVKAIPIDWIKDKMDKLEDIGRLEFCEYLDELLVDWEKENEALS